LVTADLTAHPSGEFTAWCISLCDIRLVGEIDAVKCFLFVPFDTLDALSPRGAAALPRFSQKRLRIEVNPSEGAVTKRALLVERVGGPLSGLTPIIQACGGEVSRAADARTAETLAARARRLWLVAINGDFVANDGDRLVASIKTQHPDLPILWYCADPKGAAGIRKLDLVTNDLKQLEARISCLMREEFYSAGFVQQVLAGVRGVLNGFSIDVQASDPGVKSTLTELSEVNAYLPFSGPRVSGHVVVSTSIGDLTSAYRNLFPRNKFPGQDDLEDLLGEIANQVVGHIKRCIQLEGTDCRMGLPHFLRGQAASLRHKVGAPSLCVEFSNKTQKLYLEICIHRMDGVAVAEASEGDHLRPGAFKLL
jgi:CheY-specific phosphatase CheX